MDDVAVSGPAPGGIPATAGAPDGPSPGVYGADLLGAVDRPRPGPVLSAARKVDADALVDRVIEECMAAAFEDHRHDAAFVAGLRASVTQNVHALRDVVAGATAVDALEFDDVLAFARLEAQMRIPQKALQKSYRVSFFVQWEVWNATLRAELESSSVGLDESLDATEALTALVLAYQDHVASMVAETYTRDYDALNRSRSHIRRNLVQEILRGSYDDLSATDLAILGYPLDAHHVAVLLPGVVEAQAVRLAESLRSLVGAGQTLVYPLTLSDCAIWLGRFESWRPQSLTKVSDHLVAAGLSGSVSTVTTGTEGFRQALLEAREADRVRLTWDAKGVVPTQPVVRFEDVRLEVLLSRDPDMARSFVVEELGPLASATTESVRLRETLEASFRHGSHVAAADSLQLHEHTIRNRLQRAEQLLGHPLSERRTEVQVALRLMRVIG